MAISLTEDVKTVSELKKNLKGVFEQIHRTGRPVVITVKGKPDVVLVDAAVFEEKLRSYNVALLLEEGEQSIRASGTRPMRTFLREMKRGKKASR